MIEDYYNQKREKYIETILKMFDVPDSEEKLTVLSKLLTDYTTFCYKYNLNEKDRRLNAKENDSYILPSEPEIYELNEEDTRNAALHLKEAIENHSGISEEEANILLKWSVGKAREVLAKGDMETFKKDSLGGACGFGQALTLLPFINLGVPVTINNVHEFPFTSDYHSFGTVLLPILNDGVVENRRFLLDVTVRQYYPLVYNHDGRFYSSDKYLKNKCGPEAGYYVVKYPRGKEMAMELLKKGYIKLDANVSKVYGIGFTCESLNITNVNKMNEMFQIDDELYLKIILDGHRELDYNPSDIAELSELVNFPIDNLKR